MAENSAGKVTWDNPYVIPDPRLLMLNLMGPAGTAMLERDLADLKPIFNDNISVVDSTQVPHCNVLFLYAKLDETGRVEPHPFHFRDAIKATGAHVAVIASEIATASFSNPQFNQYSNGWPANIVLTISRKGEHFGRFFQRLFADMQSGTSMPMAWVTLAPQGPVQDPDLPATILLMEAGHIAFGRRPAAG